MVTITVDTNYKNITTDEIVTVNEIAWSSQFEKKVVDYYNKVKDKSFIKPYYVFEKTYVES